MPNVIYSLVSVHQVDVTGNKEPPVLVPEELFGTQKSFNKCYSKNRCVLCPVNDSMVKSAVVTIFFRAE